MANDARQREQPDERDIVEALEARDQSLRELVLAVRAMVLETLPDVRESLDTADGVLGYGARQYGADGWGIAYLAPQARWVNLGFMRGSELPDPNEVLEGTGKRMRHVKLRSIEDLERQRPALTDLLRAAAGQPSRRQ